jgi:hypothetical protein
MSTKKSGTRTRKAGLVVAVLAALFATLSVGCATRAPVPGPPTGASMPTTQNVK